MVLPVAVMAVLSAAVVLLCAAGADGVANGVAGDVASCILKQF